METPTNLTDQGSTNPGQANPGNTGAGTASRKKLAKYSVFAIIIVVVAAMALLAFQPSGFGFPSGSEISSALNAQFTAHPTVTISGSNTSLTAEFSSFGIVGAELENYTSSNGVLVIGELKFKSASSTAEVFNNATKMFSEMASNANNSLQTYNGGKYIITSNGAIGYYKNFVFIIEYLPMYGAILNTSAMSTLAKYTISAI